MLQQSVRHHLSLNRLFERQPRPVTDPGFGSYWTVNLLAPPGTKRPRKRGRQNKAEPGKPQSSSNDGQSLDGDSQINLPQPTKYQFQPQTHPPPPPPPLPEPTVKSFNNPRAPNQYQPGALPVSSQNSHTSLYNHHGHPPSSLTQKTCPPSKNHQHVNVNPHTNGGSHSYRTSQFRSLPHYSHSVREAEKQRFNQLRNDSPGTSTSGQGSAYLPSSQASENDENGTVNRGENKASFVTISDDEYESEEDAARNREKRLTIPTAFIPLRPSPIFSLPDLSGADMLKDNIVEHMRQEIANLRRTSAEAVSTSIRLSEQLANAHFEVARYRETVRELEDILQDESVKRRDAERQREVEAERRRAAEQALGTMASRPPNRMRPT